MSRDFCGRDIRQQTNKTTRSSCVESRTDCRDVIPCTGERAESLCPSFWIRLSETTASKRRRRVRADDETWVRRDGFMTIRVSPSGEATPRGKFPSFWTPVVTHSSKIRHFYNGFVLKKLKL